MSKLSAVTLLHSKNLNSCDRLSGWSSQAKHKKQPKSRALRSHARLCETLRDSARLLLMLSSHFGVLVHWKGTSTHRHHVHVDTLRGGAQHPRPGHAHYLLHVITISITTLNKHEQTCSSYYNSLQQSTSLSAFYRVCVRMFSYVFLMIHRSSWTFMDLHSNTKPHWCRLLSFDWTSSHFEGGHPEDLSTGTVEFATFRDNLEDKWVTMRGRKVSQIFKNDG